MTAFSKGFTFGITSSILPPMPMGWVPFAGCGTHYHFNTCCYNREPMFFTPMLSFSNKPIYNPLPSFNFYQNEDNNDFYSYMGLETKKTISPSFLPQLDSNFWNIDWGSEQKIGNGPITIKYPPIFDWDSILAPKKTDEGGSKSNNDWFKIDWDKIFGKKDSDKPKETPKPKGPESAENTEGVKSKKRNRRKSAMNNDKMFNNFLNCILEREGGYNPDDMGQPGNHGILQSTYSAWLEKKGRSNRDVKDITMDEVRQIYYEEYYVASGAHKIKDAKLALYVFDTAVNCGVSIAKRFLAESKGDLDKFEELRIAYYNNLATENPEKHGGNLRGWIARVDRVRDYAEEHLSV